MTFLAWTRVAILVCGGTLMCPPGASAQSTALLQGLDLRRVGVEIVAPAELRLRLRHHVLAYTAHRGVVLADTGGMDTKLLAELRLTLMPEPIGDACREKVLYAPSLALIEPVIVLRNQLRMRDSTWSKGVAPHVRTRPTTEDLENEAERLVTRFLEDYRRANPAGVTSPESGANAEDMVDTQDGIVPELIADSVLPDARGDAALRELSEEVLQLSVLTNESARDVTKHVFERLDAGGLVLSRQRRSEAPVTLGIEQFQQPLDPQCPGRILLETGLFVIEEVRAPRAPDAPLWSDTWARQSRRVDGPMTEAQLAGEREALLDQFIQSMHASPGPSLKSR